MEETKVVEGSYGTVAKLHPIRPPSLDLHQSVQLSQLLLLLPFLVLPSVHPTQISSSMAPRDFSPSAARLLLLPPLIFFFFFFFFFASSPASASSVPAIFILGDSLVDAGNNNYINSLAKGNIKFNGIDLGNGMPNGRFCNGRTVPDLLGEFVGLPPPPAYLDPATRDAKLLKGVNYASGAGGILPSSGYNFLSRVPFGEQLTYLQNTKAQLVTLIGEEQATSLINRGLYFIVFGSNDYINNYLLKSSKFSSYTPQAFQDLVVSTFTGQLQTLYNIGARRLVLTNVGPLGCIPSQIAQRSPNGTCVQFINDLVVNFNAAVEESVNQLQAQLPGFQFITLNAYSVVARILDNPGAYGFKFSNAGCCGIGKLRGQFPCTPFAQLCNDRQDYVFWDPFHPTDASNVILANHFYTGSTDDASPMNLQQFVAST